MDYQSIPNLATRFFERAREKGEAPLFWRKRDGTYQPISWSEARRRVTALARALRARNIGPGDRVVLVSENRPEWGLADLAIMAVGAITVPAYVTNTADDHQHILTDSGAKGAIVSTTRLAERLLPGMAQAPECRFLIGIDPIDDTVKAPSLQKWDDLIAEGDRPDPDQDRAKDGAKDGDDIEAGARTIGRGNLACLIYTSGTGGRPKGVMTTHGAILHNCRGAQDLLEELDQGLAEEVFLSFLPLSHSYEHTAGLMFPISIGAQIYYAEGLDKLSTNLAEARPTLMTAVPRLYEVLHARISQGVKRGGRFKAHLFNEAVRLGLKQQQSEAGLTFWERIWNSGLEGLVRRKVAQRFGGRLKAFISGGAALNPEIGAFFIALGVPVLQGYGQTEAAPVVCCNRPKRSKIHTVGPPLKDVEVRIAEDGEILVRGELVMKGYWGDPEKTAATLIDGWLHTGDIGRFDDDGFLLITDRKKDIIVNSGGDNLSPARIEGFLTLEPEIHQAMVYGDRRPHLVALLVPDEAWALQWARRHATLQVPDHPLSALASDPAFHKALDGVVRRVNQKLSPLEKIRSFALATETFTTENGLMTPTLKIRRHKVLERYGAVLDALYA